MFLYGLTGNLGAGKSTVGEMFREIGFAVVDADRIGHQLLQQPGPVSHRVSELFPACLDEQGRLSRPRLAQEIFAEEKQRRQLEQIMHPAIWTEARRQLAAKTNVIGLVEAAVLLEGRDTKWSGLAGLVLVVAPRELRRQRALARGGLSAEQLERRLAAQMQQSMKLLRADYVIDNSATRDETRQQVAGVAALLRREAGGLT